MALLMDRKEGEEITIIDSGGEIITVFVKDVLSPKSVRIGVDAPDSVTINRREVHDAKVRDGVL